MGEAPNKCTTGEHNCHSQGKAEIRLFVGLKMTSKYEMEIILILSFKQRLASILDKELLLATVMKVIRETETFVLISMNVPKPRVRRMLLVRIPSGRFYVHVILVMLEMD